MASGLEVSAHSTYLGTSRVREWEQRQVSNSLGKRQILQVRGWQSFQTWLSIPPQQLTLVDSMPQTASQTHGWLSLQQDPNPSPTVQCSLPSVQGLTEAGRTLPAEGPWVTLNCGTTSGPVGNLHSRPFNHSSLLCVFHLGALPFMTLLPIMFYCLHIPLATCWLLQPLGFILFMSVLLACDKYFSPHFLAFWWSVQKMTFALNHSPLVCLGGGWGSSISTLIWILKPWYCTQKGQPQLPTKLTFQLD